MNLDFGFRIEVLRGIDFLIVFFLHIILAWMVAVFVHARFLDHEERETTRKVRNE